MAIKGKRRSRRGSRGVPAAPRPKIEPRKQPLLRRRWVRWTGLAVLLLGLLFGGLKLWGNLRRSSDLRSYVAALTTAQEPFLPFARSGDPERSMPDVHQGFAQGQVTPKALRDLAERWEGDIGKARDAVRGLKPPGPLRDVNEMIAQSIDLYAAAGKLYTIAAGQRELSGRKGTSAAQRERLEKQVTDTLAQIEGLRSRAQSNLQAAFARIDLFKVAWGVTSEHPRSPFSVPEGVPGGGL